MAQNDILWKGVLEETFDDFLRFVFPDADKLYDIERGFEFLDKELLAMYPEPKKKSSTRHVDKLVKVYKRNGEESWLLFHVEVQGYRDKNFGWRMFTYYYRLVEKYQKSIIAVALLTGREAEKLSDIYERSEQGTELRYKFNTLRLSDYQDKDLAVSKNPFALVLWAAKTGLLKKSKASELAIKDYKFLIFRELYKKNIYSKKKIKAIFQFLNNYVALDDPEIIRIFNEEIDQYTGQINTMTLTEQIEELREKKGRKEGKAEGRLEARQSFVMNLIEGTDFSDEKIAALANATKEFVAEQRGLLRK